VQPLQHLGNASSKGRSWCCDPLHRAPKQSFGNPKLYRSIGNATKPMAAACVVKGLRAEIITVCRRDARLAALIEQEQLRSRSVPL